MAAVSAAKQLAEYATLRATVGKWREHSAWYTPTAHIILQFLDEFNIAEVAKTQPQPSDNSKKPAPFFDQEELETSFVMSFPHISTLAFRDVAASPKIAHTLLRIAKLYQLKCAQLKNVFSAIAPKFKPPDDEMLLLQLWFLCLSQASETDLVAHVASVQQRTLSSSTQVPFPTAPSLSHDPTRPSNSDSNAHQASSSTSPPLAPQSLPPAASRAGPSSHHSAQVPPPSEQQPSSRRRVPHTHNQDVRLADRLPTATASATPLGPTSGPPPFGAPAAHRPQSAREHRTVIAIMKDHTFGNRHYESMPHTVSIFEQAMVSLDINSPEAMRYFDLAFTGSVRSFFNLHCRGLNYDAARQAMIDKYNGPANQLTTLRQLQAMRLGSFMLERRSKSMSLAIADARDHIDKTILACPPDYRGETTKLLLMVSFLSEEIAMAEVLKHQRRHLMTVDEFTEMALNEATPTCFNRPSVDPSFQTPAIPTLYGEYRAPTSNRRTKHRKFPKLPSTSTRYNSPSGGDSPASPTVVNPCRACGREFKPRRACCQTDAPSATRTNFADIDNTAAIDDDNSSSAPSSDEEELDPSQPVDIHFVDKPPTPDGVDASVLASKLQLRLRDSRPAILPASPTSKSAPLQYETSKAACASPPQSSINPSRSSTTSSPSHANTPTENDDDHIVEIRADIDQLRGVHHSSLCVDCGAPTSVVGEKTLKRILKSARLPHLPRTRSDTYFKFGSTVCRSKGQVQLALTTPAGVDPIVFSIDIVDLDVPALLGLDVLDTHALMPDNVHNKLCRRRETVLNGKIYYAEEWFVPINRSRSNHLFVRVQPPPSVCLHYTRTQLKKLHRQFHHPSSKKLFQLLKRVSPDDVDAETLSCLKEISSECSACQTIQRAPHRFRVSLGSENLRFNERIYVDIAKIHGHDVLHIVDEATRFNATRTLPDMTVPTLFRTLQECWALIYAGMPNKILCDQGSNFGPSFVQLARAWHTEVQHTGIEAHNALNVGERYHEPLRSVCRKILRDNPDYDQHFSLVLAFATKTLNDTLGPDGVVPSALVFGSYPSLSPAVVVQTPKATLKERSAIAEKCRVEMRRHIDAARVARALKGVTPAATMNVYQPGDNVLVWRERQVNNRIGAWLGPFLVDYFDDETKIVYVRDRPDADPRPYALAQVKPFITVEDATSGFLDELHAAMAEHGSGLDINDILLTEVLHPADPRARSAEMLAARADEVRNLIRRGTFRVVLERDLPDGANVLPGRFILVIKDLNGKVIYKARFCPGGHLDAFKDFLLHFTRTISPDTICLLLALASLFGFDIWTADVVQAYLQAVHRLNRKLFLRTSAPEFDLGPGELLEVLLPIYGISDSGDLWFRTFTDHHRDALEMKATPLDPALFFRRNNRHELIGLSGLYVDDLLRAGTPEFKRICQQSHKDFDMTEELKLPQEFAGFTVSRDANGPGLDQTSYAAKLEELDTSASFSCLHSARAKLAWLGHSRPDIAHSVAALSQVTRERFDADPDRYVRLHNSAVRHVKKHKATLRFPRLDRSSLRLVGYSDASFAANDDQSSQLGYIILLQDAQQRAIPICFKSYKARRVCRSAMTAETIAFVDLFDQIVTLRRQLTSLLDHDVPVQVYIDSKSLFDSISKGTKTSERRLLLDISAAREGFRTEEITNIGLVRSSNNLADGLTKSMAQSALLHLLQTQRHTPSTEQFILRP